MKALQLVGRILFGMIFVMNGAFHFIELSNLSGYTASKGVPLPEVAVIITGILLLIGGLAVITGYMPRIGLWSLVLFLVPVALIMHNFWAVGAEQQQLEMVQFLKNMSMAGAALMLLQTDLDNWPYSLGGSSSAEVGGSASGPAA